MDADRIARLLDVGRSIVSQLDLDAVLEQILEVARELTGSQYAAVGVLDDERTGLRRFVTAGIDAEAAARIGDLPRGRGVLGQLISDPRALRLPDVGRHPESFGFPVGHPPMRSFLGVPILVRGEAWGNLYLTEKAGGPYDADDEEVALVLADWAGVAILNAHAFGAEQGRRRELERGMAAYDATSEIARALAGETDLDVILELVVKRGRALVWARGMFIGLVDGDEIAVVTTAGRLDRDLAGARVPIDGSLMGRVIRLRRSQRLSDVGGTTAFVLKDRVHATGALFVPLLVRGRAIGVLAAFDRLEDGPEFDAEDERLMEAFASSAANAVATAQSVAVEGVERAIEAAEAERRRWARELHDETLQDLGALRILLGSARQTGEPGLLADAVDEAVERLSEQAGALRALITDLHPAALDRLGLAAALEALVGRIRDRQDLEVTAVIDLPSGDEPDRRVAPAVELAVYRTIQEALTNVLRHADASHVVLELRLDGDHVEARVSDDGRGFAGEASTTGFGLLGMRERMTLLGGRFTVQSAPGRGTTIRVVVPASPRVGPGLASRPA